jgi:hypothetical protein
MCSMYAPQKGEPNLWFGDVAVELLRATPLRHAYVKAILVE